jgi:demethylmenaquinone methyltransferase/2-methoxy-6-polyprenyl-1,4-benzoquinol methylase
MFSRIAARYDLANHVLSWGADFHWRQRLVRSVHDIHPHSVLDLATGSGDVAFALADGLRSGARITGMDFCQPMLDEAEAKKNHHPAYGNIEFLPADALALPVPDGSFDAVTVAFGLRNMDPRSQALREMHRVLTKPRGRLFVLEFSQPFPWFRPVYFAYLELLLPWIADRLTGDRGAYEYLGGSIASFPDRKALSDEIRLAGFSHVNATPMTFGVVSLHEAVV